MFHLTFFTIGLLFLTGVFAAMVDTVGGGGGLVALPVLLGLGLPPVTAFGTNKLQSVIGECVAASQFIKHKHLNFTQIKTGLIFVLIGASAGAILIQFIYPSVLSKLIPFLLLLVLVYMVLSPKLGKEDIHQRMREPAFYLLFGLGLGFYNGFFGPGTGSFWIFALMFFLGFNIQKASIRAKPLNTAGNLASLIWFVIAGKILYLPALAMAVGQVLGARIGAHLVISKGSRFIRPVFLVVVSLMTIDLFIKNFG